MKQNISLPILLCIVSALIFPLQLEASLFSHLFHRPSWHHYLTGTETQRRDLKQLFSELDEEGSPENRFIIIQEIIKILHNTDKPELLTLFLTTHTEKNPEDPYNAYYLLLVAQQYNQNRAEPFAAHYYERILRNYSDLLVRGRSVHHLCLTNLIELGGDAEIMISYYKELLGRFENYIEKGPIHFKMAKAYEQLGEWDLAMQSYRQFLQYPDTKVAGYPDAVAQVRSILEFNDYRNKDWTTETLDDLVRQLSYAIRVRSSRTLSKYRAKINFFAVSWEQEKSIPDPEFLDSLGNFLNHRVGYARQLEMGSSNREAYLRTTGWSYRIPTWYLYLRRIHFPADPEIHGRWEWAGIYFGERPFTISER